ncbi:MAG: heavy-metal-associated domain-containing protein [Woeseia sp.]
MRLAIAVSLLAGLLPVTALADGLGHVKQTIFGMDCAPCAYGIERSLKRLSGVEHVTVSLNDGYAEVRLGDDSRATLADIREAIRKNGFTPKGADVHVSGRIIQSDDGKLLLQTDVETFELSAGDRTALSQLAGADSAVTVSGSVASGDGHHLSIAAVE